MKSAIRQLFAMVGLASAGQVTRLAAEARDASEKVRSLEERLTKLRADAQLWKRRHEDTARMLAERQAADTERVERLKGRAEGAEAQVVQWKQRAQLLAAEVEKMRSRLDTAQRETTLAREHLMATEVKLDLIEAAIQVLDARTRETAVSRFNCARLAERGVCCEVVFVEWNPIERRPYLADLLAHAFPAGAGNALTRVVVAPEYHAAMAQNPRIGYLEYVAKNVGIRRARGSFVLVTNTDVLLGRHAVDAIAAGALAPGTVYRAARYDIQLGVDQGHLGWDALENPANHVRRPRLRPPLFAGGSGDFILADRTTFHELRGFNEVYRVARAGIDHNFLVKAWGAGVRIADIGGPVYHINHVGSFRMSKALYRHNPASAPWGNHTWHSRHVVYNNADGWGLAEAPERPLAGGARYLEFDWCATSPLVDLRRIVLPARRPGS
jgi:hypothetical protein